MATTSPKKNAQNIIFVLVLCALWFFIGWIANERRNSVDAALINSAFETIIKESIFNQKSPTELSYAAIRGMLSELNDPYAELIEPEAAEEFMNAFSGNTGVIGLYADNLDGQMVILIVYPDGPADIAGVKQGDVIVSIDGETLDDDVDSSETGLLIRGVPDTSVDLEILRGNEVINFSIIRKQREFTSVRVLPGNIGYISLTAFNVTAAEKMEESLVEILEKKPVGLIWDLRNNEGGDMQTVQDILSMLIEDGLLFSAELTGKRIEEFHAKGDAIAPDISLVVLIDESTYSAAETAAAAVSQLGRGITIGSDTYGKGLIQATLPLSNTTMLQMTIAKWYSPEGDWFQDKGVPPQIRAVDDPATETDELLEEALNLFTPTH